MTKRVLLFIGAGLATLFSALTFYAVREMFAVVIVCALLFATLFLITTAMVLAQKITLASMAWLRVQAPRWNRARRDWLFEFVPSPQERLLWQRWTYKNPVAAVAPADTDYER